MKPKGRRTGLTAAALGTGTILVALFVGRDRIAEEWWIHRLESGDLAVRVRAAEKIAEMKSLRAVPVLARLVEESGKETVYVYDAEASMGLTPIAFCLYAIGPDAMPLLEDCSRDWDFARREPTDGQLVLERILSAWTFEGIAVDRIPYPE